MIPLDEMEEFLKMVHRFWKVNKENEGEKKR
jgi:hypothetical protein